MRSATRLENEWYAKDSGIMGSIGSLALQCCGTKTFNMTCSYAAYVKDNLMRKITQLGQGNSKEEADKRRL